MTTASDYRDCVMRLYETTRSAEARLQAGLRVGRRLAQQLVLARLAVLRTRVRYVESVAMSGEQPLGAAEEARLGALLDQVEAAEAEHGRRLGVERRVV